MFFKNIFDKIVSAIGLIFGLPVFLLLTILIKIKMPDGPVLFRQKRVGLHGRPFIMYKFRSMTVNNEGSLITVEGDSRVTPLGAFLRRYKLDELPELWNVLKGDMSLVGPRPDVPGYADKLTGKNRKILQLKPGITGPSTLKYANEEKLLASVSDPVRYNEEVIFPDKVKINLDYLENYSFVLDLKILLKTIFRKNY